MDVFRRVMGLSFEQTDKFTTGSLVTRLTADITAIQQMVDFMLRMLVRDSLLFFGGIIMMLTLNVRFGIIILCALPVEIIMMIIILKKANPYYSIVAKRLDSVNSVVQENVTGARVVKAYVREDTEEKRFDDVNISLMESNLRVQTLMAILQPLLMIILNLSVIAVIVTVLYSEIVFGLRDYHLNDVKNYVINAGVLWIIYFILQWLNLKWLEDTIVKKIEKGADL